MKQLNLAILLLLACTTIKAQVGIGTTDPHPSAMLEVQSDERGVLIPSVPTLGQVLKDPTTGKPAPGLIVFLEEDHRFYFYDGTDWQCMSPFDTDETNSEIHTTDDYPEVHGDFMGTFTGYGAVPVGTIVMWSGTNIPEGWALCNGSCYDRETGEQAGDWAYPCSFENDADVIRTPNLSGKFLVGYGDHSATYTSPGNYSENANGTASSYTMATTGGKSQVQLEIEHMPTHNHDMIDHGHKHSIKGEVMQKDGTSTKSVIAIDTQSDPSHGEPTRTDKISEESANIDLHAAGGEYTYRTISNPPRLIEGCSVWEYECTTTGGTTFLTNSMLDPGEMFSSGNEITYQGQRGYQGCVPNQYYCGLGHKTNKFLTAESYTVESCKVNTDWDEDHPTCEDPYHRADLPVGKSIRVDEEWNVSAHENRPPFFAIAYIMRIK